MSDRCRADQRDLSRRTFVVQVGAAATLLHAGLPARGQTPAAAPSPVPGKDKLIVRSPRPINLETPLRELTADITPTDLFFVRNNYDGPVIDPSTWVLTVDGEVESPLTLRLEDLRRLEAVTQTDHARVRRQRPELPQAAGVGPPVGERCRRDGGVARGPARGRAPTGSAQGDGAPCRP